MASENVGRQRLQIVGGMAVLVLAAAVLSWFWTRHYKLQDHAITQPAKLISGELSPGKHDLGEGKGYIKVFKRGETTYAAVVFPDKFLDDFKAQREAHKSARSWLMESDTYNRYWVEVGCDDWASPPFFIFQAFNLDEGRQMDGATKEVGDELYDAKNK